MHKQNCTTNESDGYDFWKLWTITYKVLNEETKQKGSNLEVKNDLS